MRTLSFIEGRTTAEYDTVAVGGRAVAWPQGARKEIVEHVAAWLADPGYRPSATIAVGQRKTKIFFREAEICIERVGASEHLDLDLARVRQLLFALRPAAIVFGPPSERRTLADSLSRARALALCA